MSSQVSSALVIVRNVNAPLLVNGVMKALAEDDRIRLTHDAPVALAEACELLGQHPETSVAVLVEFDDELEEASATLREISETIRIVSLPLKGLRIGIDIPKPRPWEVASVIDSDVELVQLDVTRNTPQSLTVFADIVSTFLHPADAKSATLPAEVVAFPGKEKRSAVERDPASGADALIAELVRLGCAWLNAAAGIVRTKWTDGSGFVAAVSRDALLEWLNRLDELDTSDAPEKAYRAFADRLEETAAANTPLHRLDVLMRRDALAMKLLLIVMSVDLDIAFHRLFGVMHDDLGRRHASIALASVLLAAGTSQFRVTQRIALARMKELRSLGLIEGFDEASTPSADAGLQVNAALLEWILSADPAYLLLSPGLKSLLANSGHGPRRRLPASRRHAVRQAFDAAVAETVPVSAIVLSGSEPGWLSADAASLLKDQITVVPAPETEQHLPKVFATAKLLDRPLVFDLSRSDGHALPIWTRMVPLLEPSTTPPLVLISDPAPLLAAAPTAPLAVVNLPAITFQHRADATREVIGQGSEELAAQISQKFRLAFDQMDDAAILASSAAAERGLARPKPEDWSTGFRRASGARLPALARRVEPMLQSLVPHPLDQVILPEPQKALLESLLDHIRYGDVVLNQWGFGQRLQARGVAALFSGESGTGKSMAAHAIASSLGVDLYVIDLARVVSKYIGETEKNLDIVFNDAENAGAAILFDEADALFGERSEVSDAHDRYANIEVAYLLQRMELFDGLAILTTNHPDNIDPAFGRRLRFSIEFPRPNAVAREKIWEQAIPPAFRAEDLDLTNLARRLDLTGGSIRQIALHAAFAAARDGTRIDRRHVEAAARIELMRLGAYSELDYVRAA